LFDAFAHGLVQDAALHPIKQRQLIFT
jgi:hypothetical protein